MTASGAAKLAEMMAETIAVRDFLEWVPDGYEDKALAHIEVLRRTAAARAVDEALSVVSDLRSVLVSEHGHDSDGPAPWPACLPVHIALNRAAALVAHLRGPRPEGEG